MPFRDLPGVVECRFRKGDTIIYDGEEVKYIYYLQKGTVYREVITESGNESILSTKTGDSLVHSLVGILILYRTGLSNSNFIARTNCLCYRIPKDVCMKYLLDHPPLLEDLVRLAMSECGRMFELFQMKSEGSTSSLLCELILRNAEARDGGVFLQKKYTNVEIAKFLSVHKVTVARILRVLKEEGCVARTKNGLEILDETKLQAYANGEKELVYRNV